MTAPHPGLSRYRPASYRPSQITYDASIDDAVRTLRRQIASTVSETERIPQMLLRYYATPHLSPLREHGSNR